MEYKVGDRVRIKSLDWYNENKNHCGEIPLFKPSGLFVPDMSRYCNNIMTIKDICYGTCYRMKEDFWNYNWTDEMIEGLVEEEETKPKYEDEVSGEYYSTPKYLVRPSGYQFVDENGNVINAHKIVLEKKKKEVTYPKTFLGCCDVLGIEDTISRGVKGYKAELFDTLQKLYICRDAYWKIAGEEMGLDKPWEPDWNIRGYYAIARSYGNVVKTSNYNCDLAFVFPTEEMRDAFKENFDSYIEICKKFL